jgi:hypothetical protein
VSAPEEETGFVEQVMYAALVETGTFYRRMLFCECVWVSWFNVEVRAYDLERGSIHKKRIFRNLQEAVLEWSDLVGRRTAS